MKVSKEIDAPAEAVWELLTRTQYWPEWGPTVKEVACEDDPIGPGTTGSVKTSMGVWVDFEVTRFVPGRRWDWRVLGVPATGHIVEPQGPDACRAIITLPAVAAPYALVCRWALERIAQMATSASSNASFST